MRLWKGGGKCALLVVDLDPGPVSLQQTESNKKVPRVCAPLLPGFKMFYDGGVIWDDNCFYHILLEVWRRPQHYKISISRGVASEKGVRCKIVDEKSLYNKNLGSDIAESRADDTVDNAETSGATGESSMFSSTETTATAVVGWERSRCDDAQMRHVGVEERFDESAARKERGESFEIVRGAFIAPLPYRIRRLEIWIVFEEINVFLKFFCCHHLEHVKDNHLRRLCQRALGRRFRSVDFCMEIVKPVLSQLKTFMGEPIDWEVKLVANGVKKDIRDDCPRLLTRNPFDRV
ncbi:hypothetical protein F5877DRAFT_66148 [Lentinula edodes]|nr:hypothetical protein F5877DRAFT_66148 [Lentinula edodes]